MSSNICWPTKYIYLLQSEHCSHMSLSRVNQKRSDLQTMKFMYVGLVIFKSNVFVPAGDLLPVTYWKNTSTYVKIHLSSNIKQYLLTHQIHLFASVWTLLATYGATCTYHSAEWTKKGLIYKQWSLYCVGLEMFKSNVFVVTYWKNTSTYVKIHLSSNICWPTKYIKFASDICFSPQISSYSILLFFTYHSVEWAKILFTSNEEVF